MFHFLSTGGVAQMVQKISAVLVKAGKVTHLSVGMSLAFCILIGIIVFFRANGERS